MDGLQNADLSQSLTLLVALGDKVADLATERRRLLLAVRLEMRVTERRRLWRRLDRLRALKHRNLRWFA